MANAWGAEEGNEDPATIIRAWHDFLRDDARAKACAVLQRPGRASAGVEEGDGERAALFR